MKLQILQQRVVNWVVTLANFEVDIWRRNKKLNKRTMKFIQRPRRILFSQEGKLEV